MWIGLLWAGLRVAMWITHVGGKFRHGLLRKSLIRGDLGKQFGPKFRKEQCSFFRGCRVLLAKISRNPIFQFWVPLDDASHALLHSGTQRKHKDFHLMRHQMPS